MIDTQSRDCSTCAAEQDRLALHLSGRDLKQSASQKSIPFVAASSKSDGPMSETLETCDLFPPHDATSLPLATHASHFPKQDENWARQMIATSGRQCWQLSKDASPISFLAKTLLQSPIWFYPDALMIWKRVAISHKHSIYRLALSGYQRWNGTSGLLPRALKSDFKRPVKAAYRGSEWQKGGKHGTRLSGGRLPMALRSSKDDGTSLNPTCSEALKGLPIGWTELRQSETPPLCQSSRCSRGQSTSS